MADAVFAIILLYSFIAGARRGFYKEAVNAVAMVVSIAVTRSLYESVGAKLSAATGDRVPLMLAEAVGAAVVWAASFFVAAVVGRLVLKKIRGKGIDDNLEEGAEALADALGGDTTKGPVTLLTDPIATKTGIFYWSDKILGAGLGVLKGAITAYIVFGLCLYADRARGWNSAFVRSVESSWAAGLYRHSIDPYLRTFPAYRLAASLGHINGIADAVKAAPWRLAVLAGHPEMQSLARSQRVRELTQDDAIIEAWRAGDLKRLLLEEKVRALLSDAEFRARLADVDWERVRRDVEGARREDAVNKLIPDGRGGTFTFPSAGGGAPPEAPAEPPPDKGVRGSGADPRGSAGALLPPPADADAGDDVDADASGAGAASPSEAAGLPGEPAPVDDGGVGEGPPQPTGGE
ncbi:MAG: CvpA family protein [Planctomycetota bacterium]|nr:MAG: CvpA family protein [Planctomycetota bacterium]